MLDDVQVRQYHGDGFVVVEDFVDVSRCQELRARAIEIVEAWEPGTVTDELTRFRELDPTPCPRPTRAWCPSKSLPARSWSSTTCSRTGAT